LRVIGEDAQNLGVLSRDDAIKLSREKGLDLIEISSLANPPVVRIMSFDKFRYIKEKEEKKQKQAQKNKEIKSIRITPRAALNDLQTKVKKAEKFLENGHKVEINIFLRGRERGNRAWALKKLEEFLLMIGIPYTTVLPPMPGKKGFIAQISKKQQVQDKEST